LSKIRQKINPNGEPSTKTVFFQNLSLWLFVYTVSFSLIILVGSAAWVLTSRFDYSHGIEVAL